MTASQIWQDILPRVFSILDGGGCQYDASYYRARSAPTMTLVICVLQIGKKIVVVDGQELADLMIDHDIGVSRTRTCDVKEIDLSYFETE